ncbi:hypothetical protein [Goodfellowiella coeruleoviolacea]|uniref:Uncharacterized protein n=1 Tax=Goodfellowiella coeruleoviolacea TaxID=334858 RepID=A0AAE3GKM3_9PSEU|nr:hypothetical protein [Goodfellowiella coeruleoviolacea]MCP2169124.1 hypothetical protein [Goodfellowiella coeruleoviolacea]
MAAVNRVDGGRHRRDSLGRDGVTVSRLLARLRAEGRRLRLDWPAEFAAEDYDQCTTIVLPLRGATC